MLVVLVVILPKLQGGGDTVGGGKGGYEINPEFSNGPIQEPITREGDEWMDGWGDEIRMCGWRVVLTLIRKVSRVMYGL